MPNQPPALVASVQALFRRDLAAMAREIRAYPDDDLPWRAVLGLSNAGGNLALHVAGNLQHFVGAVLGHTGYVRDRAREFAARGLPRSEVVAQLVAATAAIETTLPRLTDADLAGEYPISIAEQRVATGDLLVHLAVHAGYHLGQLDYHRRAVLGLPETVGTMSVPALATARLARPA
jgi:hypothetical protein